MFICRTIVVLLASAAAACVSCVKVDPRSDFRAAASSAAERNSAREAYDPAAEALIAPKIRALLNDGLTLDEAVTVALLNNPGFQAEFLSIGVSRADVVQSGLLANPSMFLSVRFPEAGGRSSLNVSFAQQIVDLWQIPVRKKVAEADLQRTVANVLDRGVQLTADVRGQCVRVLALERAQAIADENLRLTLQVLKLAQVRLNVGETDAIDVNLVNGHVFEVEQLLIGIRRELGAAQLLLAETLGLIRWPDAWNLVGNLDQVQDESVDIGNIDDLLQLAQSERFDLRVIASQVASAEAQLEREYLEIFPNVTLGLEGERTDRRALPGRNIAADTARASVAAGTLTAPTIESRSQRDLQRRQIVDSLLGPSMQITLPLWDQNQAQIEKTRYTVLQLRKQHEEVLNRAAREVRQAHVTAKASGELAKLLETRSLPRARQNVDIVRRQYENGEQGILILLESQEFLLKQSRAYVDALRESALAAVELTRAVGGRRPPRLNGGVSATRPDIRKE